MGTKVKTQTKEKQLKDLVLELYRDYDRVIEPLYPWIFVRVLPKEQQIGSIVLPDTQNKTQYEGIVLATYKTFWQVVTKDSKEAQKAGMWRNNNPLDNIADVCIRSSVVVGDHIVFPHHVGLPDPVFDEKKYRLIKEEDIHAVLKYGYPTPQFELADRFIKWGGPVGDAMNMASEFARDYDFVPKNAAAKTRSGV